MGSNFCCLSNKALKKNNQQITNEKQHLQPTSIQYKILNNILVKSAFNSRQKMINKNNQAKPVNNDWESEHLETQSIKKEQQKIQQELKEFFKQDQEALEKIKKQRIQKYKQQRRIMQKFQAQDRRARAIMNNQPILQDQFNKQCQICLCQISLNDIGTFKCGHIFHIQCINAYIKEIITANKAEIFCPHEQCNKLIDQNDIRQYTDQPLYLKFMQNAFRSYVEKNPHQVSWCPTADCSAVFVFDQQMRVYSCPICNKSYCLQCKSVNHVGMTCAQNKVNSVYSQNDKKFQSFVKGAKYKQCPQCKFWVSKNEGCNHMTCRCNYQFCYNCGREYPKICKTC